MVKIQKISEIEPRLGFTEFDMLKKYRQSFATSELGRLHALFPFSELARQMHLKSSALGRKSYFSPEGKIALMVLKSYTNFSDAQLIEHLNGNIVNSTLAVSNIRNRTYTNCEVYLIDYGYGNFKEKIHFME